MNTDDVVLGLGIVGVFGLAAWLASGSDDDKNTENPSSNESQEINVNPTFVMSSDDDEQSFTQTEDDDDPDDPEDPGDEDPQDDPDSPADVETLDDNPEPGSDE